MLRFDTFKIHTWEEIRDDFTSPDLFLGNGFSISIDQGFNYRSLFNKFLTYCSPAQQAIFRKFNSTNFEAIQENLQSAIQTNAFFNIGSRRLQLATRRLQEGLITSVSDLHPSHTVLSPTRLGRICRQLDQFHNIYTTNYDTFLYYIILAVNERCHLRNIRRFQDFFRRRDDHLKFVHESSDSIYRNVYYLHGALFFFKDSEFPLGTIKIEKQPNVELLNVIQNQIAGGEIPIFVSEGTSLRKLYTINSNTYLTFCKKKFEKSQRDMVFYGFSFSRPDDHLINILNTNFRRRTLAISIHLDGRTTAEIVGFIRTVQSKLSNFASRNVKFFDASTLFN